MVSVARETIISFMKTSSLLKVVISLVATLAAAYLVWWWFVPAYSQRSGGLRTPESLLAESAEMNRGLPAMMDKETELMITEAGPGLFVYKYRLVNLPLERVDPQVFIERVKPQLVRTSCSRPETRGDFLDRGVTMRYSYFDSEKHHIATIDVTPADCGL
jgi:hypothetical protein